MINCSTRSNFVGGEHNPKCGFTLSLARSLALSFGSRGRAAFAQPEVILLAAASLSVNPTRYVLFDFVCLIFFIVFQKMASPSLPPSSTEQMILQNCEIFVH
jgi:hypothetical protein